MSDPRSQNPSPRAGAHEPESAPQRGPGASPPTPSQNAAAGPPAKDTRGAEPPIEAEQRPSGRTVALRLAIAAVLVAADLWSKTGVFAWIASVPEGLVRDDHGHLRYPVFGEWFAWMLSRNPGAAFGGFASVPHLLVGGRIIAVLFLTWLVARTPTGRRFFNAALVLVLGGATGNLWDNLFQPRPPGRPFGEVRDFIDVYFRFDWTVPLAGWRWDVDWHFPTFNVADSCITVGAVLLLASGLFREGESRGEAKAAS